MTSNCKGLNNILIFIDWYLPGFKAGGPIRSVKNIIDHLNNSANFYIVTSDRDYNDKKPYPEIILNEWTSVGGAQIIYLSPKEQTIKRYTSIIRQVDFSAVYINGVFSLKFSLLPLLAAKLCHVCNIVVATRGMLAPGSLAVKAVKKKLFLIASKLLSIYSRVTFHATNAEESNQINLIFNQSRTVILPNLTAYRPSTNNITTVAKLVGELELISIARISPEKNTKFMLRCLQALPNFEGSISLNMYGPVNNEEYWQECQAIVAKLPDNIMVKYQGSLDHEKVAIKLAQGHFLFMPSTGENFGHTIVESFLAARPVIISDKTPWTGLLDASAGWDLPLNLECFTDALLKAIRLNNTEFAKYCLGALSYGQSIANNNGAVEGYKKLFGI